MLLLESLDAGTTWAQFIIAQSDPRGGAVLVCSAKRVDGNPLPDVFSAMVDPSEVRSIVRWHGRGSDGHLWVGRDVGSVDGPVSSILGAE